MLGFLLGTLFGSRTYEVHNHSYNPVNTKPLTKEDWKRIYANNVKITCEENNSSSYKDLSVEQRVHEVMSTHAGKPITDITIQIVVRDLYYIGLRNFEIVANTCSGKISIYKGEKENGSYKII